MSSRPSTPGSSSSSSDDDEHTLCAYGEISLSNIYYIPSLPTTVTPRRDGDSWMDEKEEKKTPPPSVRKRRTAKVRVMIACSDQSDEILQHALPSVIQKILPPSPSAAELSPKFEFERLVAKLRETRVSDKDRPQPGLMLPSPPKPIQPQQAVDRKAIDKMQDKCGTKDTPATIMPLQPSARMNAARPKQKEKPFRGGKLPVRPPLPRWDLHEASRSRAQMNSA